MLFGILPYEQYLLGLAGIPMQLFFTAFQAWLLDIRWRKAFWVCEFILIVCVTPFRTVMPELPRLLVGLAISLFVPFIFARDGLLRRVLVCVGTIVAMLAAESVVALMWIAETGQPYGYETVLVNQPLLHLDMLVATLRLSGRLRCWRTRGPGAAKLGLAPLGTQVGKPTPMPSSTCCSRRSWSIPPPRGCATTAWSRRLWA